jgi:hypothetical protein
LYCMHIDGILDVKIHLILITFCELKVNRLTLEITWYNGLSTN